MDSIVKRSRTIVQQMRLTLKRQKLIKSHRNNLFLGMHRLKVDKNFFLLVSDDYFVFITLFRQNNLEIQFILPHKTDRTTDNLFDVELARSA